MTAFRVDGRVALVTGAGPNNGHAIAHALAAAGAAVAVSDQRDDHSAAGAESIEGAGGRAIAVPIDITDIDAVRAGVARVERKLGPVDILVNNAGTLEAHDGVSGGQVGQFIESDPSLWHRWIDLNLYGSLHCMRVVVPKMVARQWGRVVQISSGTASRGMSSGHSLYGATKAAAEAAVRHIAIENAREGVTVNALSLGPMEIIGALHSPALDGVRARIPVGRDGLPDEVGAAVVWLASDAGEWITGQTIHINGGIYQGR